MPVLQKAALSSACIKHNLEHNHTSYDSDWTEKFY